MGLLSYQVVVFSADFLPLNTLNIGDEKTVSFIKKFLDLNFIPQRTQTINVEVNSNLLQQKLIDIIDFRSIDKKWNVEFRPSQISITYNHAYPVDNFSLTDFRTKVFDLFKIMEDEFNLSACNRIGFVKKMTEDDLSSFLSGAEIEENKIIEKTEQIVSKKFIPDLKEDINHTKIKTFSQHAEIQTIEAPPISFKGLYILDDINTLASNLSPRFDKERIVAFINFSIEELEK